MKNKVLKIATIITTLCVGVMLSSVGVYAANDTESEGPKAGSVYVNEYSHKREYCPNAEEFETRIDGDKVMVEGLKGDIECEEDYDAVMIPGSFIIGGKTYPAYYDGNTFKDISDKGKGKGVVVQSGATVSALQDNLDIDYIRFDSGSKLVSYANAFRGWQSLTTVEGFIEAIEPGNNGIIELGNTFSGCSNLESITLDFKNKNVTMYKTFDNCNKLKTIVIKNANMNSISQLAVRGNDAYSDVTGVNIIPMNITFENITFPSNDTGSYLANAFESISGKITFKNCLAGESNLINFDSSFAKSKAIKQNTTPDAQYNKNCPGGAGNYNGGNIEISGAHAYSASYMFNESVYGVITLNDFVVEDTERLNSMFVKAKFVNIKGLDTWELGPVDMSSLFKDAETFYDSESNVEQINYLETQIIPDLRKVDFSEVTKANEMFCFADGGYVVDYRELNLSGVGTFIPVNSNIPFYTPKVAPGYYKLPYDNAYYQTEQDKGECGGYKLTMATGTRSTIAGSALETNTLIMGTYANVRITNSVSGDSTLYNVIPGYKLGDYLNEDVDYFSDSNCTTPAALTGTVREGTTTAVYTNTDCIEDDLDEDVSYKFGVLTGNISGMVEGSTSSIRLIDHNPKITIKKEQHPDKYTLTTAAKSKSESQFYNIGISVVVNGEEKQIKSISRPATVTVPLPDDYDGKGIIILHYNNGLDKAPSTVNSTVDRDAGTVQFNIDSFSHIALLYNESDTETKTITVKWNDNGNHRNRSNITFNWTATYGDDVITDSGSITYTVDSVSETELSFDVHKVISGEILTGIEVVYDISNKDIKHTPVWDEDTYTLTLSYNDLTEYVNKMVNISFNDMDDDDFNSYVAKNKTLTLTVRVDYDDGSFETKDTYVSLSQRYKMYNLSYELKTVKEDGAEYTNITYSINMPEDYYSEIDYDAGTFVVTKDKDVFDDFVKFTVTGFFNDSDDKMGIRPREVKVLARAKFGDKEWTGTLSIICRTIGYTGYSTDISIPNTCNGIPRDDLTFEPDPVTGYKITVSKIESDSAWIDFDLEDDSGINGYKQTVEIMFINDNASSRPSMLTVYMQDSKGGNKIKRTIDISSGASSFDVDVPTNDTYTVTNVEGLGRYTVSYFENTIVAIYNQTVVKPSDYQYTQNFSIDINDKENEDGSRPAKMTVTVSDGKGSEEKFEIEIPSGKTFTKSIKVPDETAWTITKIEGFPERYSIKLSANTATVEYMPEKMTKKVSVKFEGDADDADETRPTSIVVHVNNGTTLVTNATLDKNTNWSANVELNKYIAGVEAKYTIDCDDVKNYSKKVDEDVITLTFTGTLTAKAQEALSATNNSTDGTGEFNEYDFSIESFDWIDYANRYPDLKRAYGYNKQKLYAHYIRYGIAEGRRATFTGKYSSVNEDILAAYFPDDYKYALIQTGTDSSTTTTVTTTDETSLSENTVSGNSLDIAEPTDDSTDGVTVNEDGTTTEKITNEDGTITEITKDVEGNIISTKQYKTGDTRDTVAYMLIIFGILSLLTGACIGVYTLKCGRLK